MCDRSSRARSRTNARNLRHRPRERDESTKSQSRKQSTARSRIPSCLFIFLIYLYWEISAGLEFTVFLSYLFKIFSFIYTYPKLQLQCQCLKLLMSSSFGSIINVECITAYVYVLTDVLSIVSKSWWTSTIQPLDAMALV